MLVFTVTGSMWDDCSSLGCAQGHAVCRHQLGTVWMSRSHAGKLCSMLPFSELGAGKSNIITQQCTSCHKLTYDQLYYMMLLIGLSVLLQLLFVNV